MADKMDQKRTFLSMSEAAAHAGYCYRHFRRKALDTNQLQVVHIGRRKVIIVAELEQWMRTNKPESEV